MISIQANKYSLAEGYPYNLLYTCFGACVALSFVFTDSIMACTWAETCSSETLKEISSTALTIVLHTSCVQSSVLYNGHIYCILGSYTFNILYLCALFNIPRVITMHWHNFRNYIISYRILCYVILYYIILYYIIYLLITYVR
jgi:hypothetical protein